jgi:hypothetical protein
MIRDLGRFCVRPWAAPVRYRCFASSHIGSFTLAAFDIKKVVPQRQDLDSCITCMIRTGLMCIYVSTMLRLTFGRMLKYDQNACYVDFVILSLSLHLVADPPH